MRRAAPVLLLLLLAGCSQPSDEMTSTSPSTSTPTDTSGPNPSSPSYGPASLQLQQFGCESRYGFFEVDEAYAQRMLPEGFEADSLNFLTGGTLAVKAWRCESSLLGSETIEAPQTLLYYLAVRPPEKYASPDAVAYWLVLGWASSDEREAALFASWNMTDATPGRVVVESTPVGDATRVSATATAPGYEASYDGLLGARRESSSFTVRYFGLRDGEVAGIVDIVVHDGLLVSNGQATATIAAARSPGETPMVGVASEQVWPADAISYTWTKVDLPP